MALKERKSGLEILGDIPWGTHFCLFYQLKEDLIDILVPYFKAGLENNEYCMWVTSEPLNEKDAERAIRKAMPNFEHYLEKKQIEIIPHNEWYLKNNEFNSQRVLDDWVDKLNYGLSQGFKGLRLTGNTFWLEEKDWKAFTDYEEEVNNIIGNYNMIGVCTYSLEKCGPYEIIDVIRNHQFALIRREGKWNYFKSMEQLKAEQKLKESEKMYRKAYKRAEFYKDLFTHDINNILQNISMGIQLSETYIGDPEKTEKKLKKYNSIIKDQLKRGANLVSNIRKLSKLEEAEILIKKVEIYSILEKSITYMKNAYQDRNIDIQVDSIGKKLYVQANELLEDVFENILVNAIKYNEDSMIEIEIKISNKERDNTRYIKMEFLDNGKGIEDNRKKIIFKRGYSEAKSIGGMGLGLSLVKEIIKTYNGKIWVEDRVKGDYSKGSNFIVLIPEVS